MAATTTDNHEHAAPPHATPDVATETWSEAKTDHEVRAAVAAAELAGQRRPGRDTLVELFPRAVGQHIRDTLAAMGREERLRRQAAALQYTPSRDEPISTAEPQAPHATVNSDESQAGPPPILTHTVSPLVSSGDDRAASQGLGEHRAGGQDSTPGTQVSYVAAGLATGLSIDTSWTYFTDRLHLLPPVAAAVFLVLEVSLLGCALRMRAAARQGAPAGSARWIAWGLCGVAAYMGIAVSGLGDGLARAVLGPVLATLMLHQALGAERRAHRGAAMPAWRRVGTELSQRLLSRLGVADDERDAVTRIQRRAARRAARLAVRRRVIARQARLERAIHTAGVAHNPQACQRMLAEVAALQHAKALTQIVLPSPWTAT